MSEQQTPLRCNYCLELMTYDQGAPFLSHSPEGRMRYAESAKHFWHVEWSRVSLSELTLYPGTSSDYCGGAYRYSLTRTQHCPFVYPSVDGGV